MAVYPDDVAAAKKFLWAEETVQVTATQRKNPAVGGTVINPTTVVATDKRIIIINRETLGIRKDVESIPYNRIASVRFEGGIISSSVFIVVAGYVSPPGEQGFLKQGKSEGEIGGLHKGDAKALADFINKMISGVGPQMQQPAGGKSAGAIYCSKCGAQNSAGSKFCSACGAKIG